MTAQKCQSIVVTAVDGGGVFTESDCSAEDTVFVTHNAEKGGTGGIAVEGHIHAAEESSVQIGCAVDGEILHQSVLSTVGSQIAVGTAVDGGVVAVNHGRSGVTVDGSGVAFCIGVGQTVDGQLNIRFQIQHARKVEGSAVGDVDFQIGSDSMFIFSAAGNNDIAVLSAEDILSCHTIGYSAGVGLIGCNIAESGIAGSFAVEGDFGVAGHGAVKSGSTIDGDPLVGAEGFDIVAEQIMIAVDGQITIGSAVDSGICFVSELGTIGGTDITVIAAGVGIGGAAEGDRSCFSHIQDSGKIHQT